MCVCVCVCAPLLNLGVSYGGGDVYMINNRL